MKYRTKAITLALVAVFSLGITNAVFAVDNSTTTSPTNEQDKQVTTEEKAEKLRERLEARRNKAALQLDEFQKARLKTRCKTAQGMIARIDGRVKGLETSRTQVHQNLIDRLAKLSSHLKEKGLDMTTLEGQIAELKTKIDVFKADLAEYKQALSDLSEMDCQTDPEAFKASLEVARELRQQLHENSQDIRTFLRTTIKASLKTVRGELAKASDTEGEQ